MLYKSYTYSSRLNQLGWDYPGITASSPLTTGQTVRYSTDLLKCLISLGLVTLGGRVSLQMGLSLLCPQRCRNNSEHLLIGLGCETSGVETYFLVAVYDHTWTYVRSLTTLLPSTSFLLWLFLLKSEKLAFDPLIHCVGFCNTNESPRKLLHSSNTLQVSRLVLSHAMARTA
ncbi:hypothetical protein RRG08_040870 [Elysia crispata]|uniref:Uncharacterized protein n=1 Tax=Elysia crispata TaxID=231223 RepID=A0AAE1B0V6_9GAST|nr:hypothetical protein RRG08_040870 [Elysia crispata]